MTGCDRCDSCDRGVTGCDKADGGVTGVTAVTGRVVLAQVLISGRVVIIVSFYYLIQV